MKFRVVYCLIAFFGAMHAAQAPEEPAVAIARYKGLIKTAPGNPSYHSKLGAAYLAAGRPRDAETELRSALKLNPALIEARDYLGAVLAETGRCPEALPLLKSASTHPTETALKRRVEIAAVRCSLQLARLEDTLSALRLLNRDFPYEPEALYVATHAYSDLSIQTSAKLAAKAPNSAQAHLLNAEALEVQGKWDEAAMEYKGILARYPNEPGIHYRLGRLIMSKPPTSASVEEARHEFEEELKVSPGNAGAEYVLGELSRQKNDLDDAIAHFKRASELDTEFPEAKLGLGRSLLAAGRAAEALAPLEAAIKLQPENPDLHYQLAVAYRMSGKREEAAREFEVRQQLIDKKHAAEAPPQ